jgi:hypothetical protein
MMTDCLVTFTEDDLMMYNDEIMMPCMTTCDSSMVAPAICEACGIASAVASVCATGTHVYCSDACRLVDGPRHAAVCLAPLAGVVVEQKCEFLLETEFLGASQPAPQSLAQWMQQANSLTANKDVVSNVDGKRRRLSADDDAPQQPAQLLLDDVFHNANPLMFFPHELLLAPQPPVLLVAASSPESSTICCSVESPLNTSGFSLVSDDDDDAGAAELIEPRLAQQPRRARSETAAKKHKRNEYAQLDDAERAKLRELGVPDVDALAIEFAQVVDKVVYLHTRRQHIIVWLADSDLFPLLSWDRVDLDDCGQPRLLLHAKREHVHAALAILLKSDITEWLFKRVRRATTSEGAWLFKPGQFQLLLKHAQKAIGESKR